METHVYLVRHGETAWNRERRFQGHQDVPLSPAGLFQAERLAQRLKSETFDAVYSSDLKRAVQTAEIVARELALPVVTLKGLRERSMGEWEGLTQEEVAARFPDWPGRIVEGKNGIGIPIRVAGAHDEPVGAFGPPSPGRPHFGGQPRGKHQRRVGQGEPGTLRPRCDPSGKCQPDTPGV